MHSSCLLILLAAISGQPADTPPMFREFAPAITYYYKSPDPALGAKMLKELLKKENLEHPFFEKNGHVLALIGAQLGDIATGKPKIVRQYEAEFGAAPLGGRRVIVRALTNCGDAETVKQVNVWLANEKFADIRPELEALKKHLQDPKRQHVRDRAAKTPDDLDLLWSNFFITGDYAPISRILDVLDQPDARQNAVMKRVAKWSFGSNLQQHPKLIEIVQQHAGERKEGSRKVLEEFNVVKGDPKAVEQLTAAVIGKWISDDARKIPLEFGKDGSAKVGFIQQDDKWLIAEGKFTVSGSGVVRSRTTYEGSTLTNTWTLKEGSLFGSFGPTSQVKWVKQKEEKK